MVTQMSSMETIPTHLCTVEQLAAFMHKSPASIRSDVSRNPEALPPICRLPGNKRLLWRWADIDAWVSQHVRHDHVINLTHSISTKKRGRPRKPTVNAYVQR